MYSSRVHKADARKLTISHSCNLQRERGSCPKHIWKAIKPKSSTSSGNAVVSVATYVDPWPHKSSVHQGSERTLLQAGAAKPRGRLSERTKLHCRRESKGRVRPTETTTDRTTQRKHNQSQEARARKLRTPKLQSYCTKKPQHKIGKLHYLPYGNNNTDPRDDTSQNINL